MVSCRDWEAPPDNQHLPKLPWLPWHQGKVLYENWEQWDEDRDHGKDRKAQESRHSAHAWSTHSICDPSFGATGTSPHLALNYHYLRSLNPVSALKSRVCPQLFVMNLQSFLPCTCFPAGLLPAAANKHCWLGGLSQFLCLFAWGFCRVALLALKKNLIQPIGLSSWQGRAIN